MSGTRIPKSDPLLRRRQDGGYIVAWKYKHRHEAGRFAGDEMTYGQACERCAQLAAQEPDKTFWPELTYEE